VRRGEGWVGWSVEGWAAFVGKSTSNIDEDVASADG